MICYRNAQPVMNLSVADRAFQYGDGCFTTARLLNNQWQLRLRHLARLKEACQRLSLDADLSLIEQSLKHLQHAHGILNGTLKIMISRGVGPRGYAMPQQAADVYVMYFPQTESHISSARHIDSGLLQRKMGLCMPELCGIKTLNRLEQVLLKQEAQQCHWPEALVSDLQGHVVEGISSNCFILFAGQWITPDLAYNGICGVMRAEILTRMQQQGIAHQIRAIHSQELTQMQALFFCNALMPMQAVSHFNGQALHGTASAELFQQLNLAQID